MANTIRASKNTFNGGLVMDLSPDNTPNEVLTSALNATLITFNGNEMSLQNDMGNGRVETARLPEGYIPVGTCEFGDIIYIVSYNPLTNKSLIGCFPSPERNISSEEVGSTGLVLESSDFQILNGSDPTGELKANSVKKIIYDNKLNPGDKFIIYTTNRALREKKNFGNITDMGNTTHIYGLVPKLLKIHVIAIEDSGKINYLDSTLRWYDKDGVPSYFISECKDNDSSKPDLDSYRDMLSSGYSVFQSKVSGKLALLIELEKIIGFSCTYSTYLSKPYTPQEESLEQSYKTYKDCKVYWNINWETEDVNINPKYIVLTKSELTGKTQSLAGKIGYYNDEYTLDLNKDSSNTYDGALLPTAFPDNNYWYSEILTNYSMICNGYDSFKNASYQAKLLDFINYVLNPEILDSVYTGQTLSKLNINRISDDRTSDEGYRSIPDIDNSGGNYYINATSMRYDDNNKLKVYTLNPADGANKEISPFRISDDIVNNYFHSGVYKNFHTFEKIPIKQVINGREFIPDITNLIYHYEITPAMPYGLLREYSIDGYIDFSKIGTGKIDLNGWKYFNTENTSTLTINLEAYTEENMGIAEVVLEFYDNQGFAAGYHITGKESYSGQFTEYIPLNGYSLNYKLNSYDYTNTEHVHAGVELSSLEGVTSAVCLSSSNAKPTKLNIKDQKAYDNNGDQYTGTIYDNDCGTIYGNILYLVKIVVKYCPYNALGELDTLDDSKFKTFYRWYWTNTMYNLYYYNTPDFDVLKFNLVLDIAPKYASTQYYRYGKFNYSSNNDDIILDPDELYKIVSTNVQVVSSSNENKGNMSVTVDAGLQEAYNTFNLRKSENNSEEYAETHVKIDIICDGDTYVENFPETPEHLHVGEGLTTSSIINPVCSNIFGFDGDDALGKSIMPTLNDYGFNGEGSDEGELNTSVNSYKRYKNCFNLKFLKFLDDSYIEDSGDTIGNESTDLYITYDLRVVNFSGKHYIRKLLKDIYDDNTLDMLTRIIHFSKYIPIKSKTESAIHLLVPLIETQSDLELYGLTLCSDNKVRVSNLLYMQWWNDMDSTDEHFRVKRYVLDDTRFVNTHIATWYHEWENRPSFSVYSDSNHRRFYDDDLSGWLEFIGDHPGFILTGFDYYDGYHNYDNHGLYVCEKNGLEETKSESFPRTFYSKYGISQIFNNIKKPSINTGHPKDLGLWRDTDRVLLNLSYNGDQNNNFHFLNNWFIAKQNVSGSKSIELEALFNGSNGEKYPVYIGNVLASMLASIYVYRQGGGNITTSYESDIVYLSENYTTYTLDIVYKIYVDPDYSNNNDPSLSNHNDLILIGGMYYNDYLSNVITNSGMGDSDNEYTRNNIDLNLLSAIKNCPILFRMNYLIPGFGSVGDKVGATVRVKPLYGNEFSVEGNVEQDGLYYIKNVDGRKYAKELDMNFTPTYYDKFIAGDGGKLSAGDMNKVTGNTNEVTLGKFEKLYTTFIRREDTLLVNKSTVPASGRCYSLGSKEDGWMWIYDLYKEDVVIPYLQLYY